MTVAMPGDVPASVTLQLGRAEQAERGREQAGDRAEQGPCDAALTP